MVTFSTSVGLAMEEEMTPERMPHITLVSNVSSEREEWAADCNCEQAAFDAMQQLVMAKLYRGLDSNNELFRSQKCENMSKLCHICTSTLTGMCWKMQVHTWPRQRENGTHPRVCQPAGAWSSDMCQFLWSHRRPGAAWRELFCKSHVKFIFNSHCHNIPTDFDDPQMWIQPKL